MSSAAAATLSSAPLWFATRAAGIVAFVLLTATFALGLAATRRVTTSQRWSRLFTQQLHRNLSLLAVGMLAVHIVSAVVDSYVNIGWLAVLVPGASSYERLPVAIGTFAFDLMLVVIGTSLLRHRLPYRAWRAVHWTAYAMWPLAALHFITAGTDGGAGHFGRPLALACLGLLVAATAVRWITRDRQPDPDSAPTASSPRLLLGQP